MRNTIIEFIGDDRYSYMMFKSSAYVITIQGTFNFALWLSVISYLSSNVPQFKDFQIIILGVCFLLSSQFGKFVSEYLLLNYEHSLVLRRLSILLIISGVVLVVTTDYTVLSISVCFLGFSTGGDVYFSSYLKPSKKNMLIFGLAWSLGFIIFESAEIVLIDYYRYSRKYLLLATLMLTIIVSLLKSNQVGLIINETRDSTVLLSRNTNANEPNSEILVPLIVIPEKEEKDSPYIEDDHKKFVKILSLATTNTVLLEWCLLFLLSN